MNKLWFSTQLKGLDFTEKEVKKALELNEILQLTVYTIGICNAECPSCFISQADDKYSELTLDEYLLLIKDAANMGVKTIKISGAGEPLIVKDIIPILDLCYELELTTVIYTNGITLGDHKMCASIYGFDSYELIDYLKSRNVSLVYKFNSAIDKIQDYLLGKDEFAGKLYRGIFNLLLKDYNRDNRLAFQTIITPYNLKEVEDLYKFCRNLKIIPYFETVLKKEEATNHTDLYLSDQENRVIFEKLSEIDREIYGIDWFPVPSFANFQCTELYYSMLIDNFGYIRVCAGIWKEYGNIREESINWYWNEPNFKRIRNELDNKLKGKCKNCEIRELDECAYGCRAYSYINDSDIFGEYSECWHG